MVDRRRLITAVLAATAMLGLVGCEAIPSSGPVQPGLADLREAEQFVQFNPLGPVAGSSQEDIVRGFVLAASANEGDYAVAREFLTPGYVEQWDPGLGVLIDEGARLYSQEGDSVGVLEVSALAKVDAEGELLPLGPGPGIDMRFEFEQIEGEWRIASAPAGIILDRPTFTSVWSPHQLYFINSIGILVPETRWYLSRASLATEIVNGLLAGPSEGMTEVLHSGFPAGTALAASAVAVADGKARIDLTPEAIASGPEASAEMYGQLRESLKSVPGVIGFEVTVDGAVVREPMPREDEPVTPTTETSSPAVLRDGLFGTVAHGEFVESAGLGQPIASEQPTAITLASDGLSAAVLGRGGVSRVSAELHTVVDERPGLLSPDIDLLGYIWSIDAAGDLVVSSEAGGSFRVPADWLHGAGAVAVRISPDGSRIAAFAPGDSEHSVVSVAGVVRDGDGVPVRVAELANAQIWVVGKPVDLDWIDTLRFTVLSREGNAGNIGVGGPGLLRSEQGVVPQGAQVASGGSRSQLRVLNEDGELFVSQGSGWQKTLGGVEVLAK